jgi:hypothetical protein
MSCAFAPFGEVKKEFVDHDIFLSGLEFGYV